MRRVWRIVNRFCEFLKENAVVCVIAAVAVPVICTVGCYAYTHRIVESKTYPVTAVVTDSYYHPSYYATSHHTDKNGQVRTDLIYHPPVYGLYYSVDFEGGTYAGNYDTVSEPVYYINKNGGTLQATFRKEWRADGSETYSIYLN